MKDTVTNLMICLLLGLFAGCGMGLHTMEKVQQNKAVREGHAEYYFDADFQKQWRWKTNCNATLKGELK